MAPSKIAQRLGGCSQPSHIQNEMSGLTRSGHVGSLSSACRNLSLNDKVFAKYTGPTKDPSTMSALERKGTSSRSSASGSRHLHYSADDEDTFLDTFDDEKFVSRRSTLKVNKKVSSQRQPVSGAKSSASEDRIYYLGRLLTSILRHRAVELKLTVRSDGYVAVSDILKLGIRTMRGIPLTTYTVDDVVLAVERDNKQRFGLLTENGVLLIRANQGHSIKTIESEKLLKPILSADEIPVCVHGTMMSNLDSILKTGLKKMGRNHVHFASGLPKEDGVISGMRHTSEVLIYLDAKKALEDGMKLYLSENGVILTEGFDGVVPPEYFAQLAKWSKGKIIPLRVNVKA